jgi:hypothetical protein
LKLGASVCKAVAGSFDLYVLLCTAQGWAGYPFAQVDGVT